MAKRFTDNEIWKSQRWFRKLHPEYKLAFCYIKDQCNHAGVWKIDCSDLIEDLGLESFTLNDFIDAVNVEFDKMTGNKTKKERVLVIKETLLWITGFIQFQYEGKDKMVNWQVPAVRTALVCLEGLGTLSEGLEKSFITLKKPLDIGWQTYKDKDKDKDSISTGEKNKNGIRFSDDKKSVYFEDGTFQKLGPDQIISAKTNDYSRPRDIVKGLIY